MKKRPSLSLLNNPTWGALQIAAAYLLIGGLWILFSDQVAARIARSEQMLAIISLYKGWAYVLITALLLYLLIQRHTANLRASEIQLHRILDSLPALISYVDRERCYQFTNRAYHDWFEGELLGKHVQEVIGASAYKAVSQYIDRVFSGETVQYETEVSLADGERFVQGLYVPDIAAGGKVKGYFALIHDLTEQKKAQEELQLWANAFEGCYHGIVIGDPHTNRVVVCNPAFARMLNRSVEAIVGSAVLSLYAPSDHERVRRNTEKADQIGYTNYESRMVRKDGSTFPVQIDVVSVLGEDGELLHRVVTAQDITERKQAEEKLKESEAKYRTLAEHLPAITYISEPDQYVGVTYISPQIGALGFDREAWLTDPELWFRCIHPDDQERVKSELEQFQAGAASFRSEYRLLLPSGEVRWFHDESIRVKDQSGKTLLKQGFMLDITENKQAEEALRKSQAQLAGIVSSAMDAIISTDADQRILIFNPAAEAMFRCAESEAIGQALDRFLPERFREMHRKHVDNFGQTGLTKRAMKGSAVVFGRRSNGEEFPCEASISQIDIAGEKIYTVILRDISERIQAEEYLRRFELLSENSRDIILFMGREDGRILEANEAAVRAYGYSREDLLSLTIRDLRAPDTLSLTAEQMAQADARGILFETTHRRKDSSTFPVEVSSQGASIGGARTLISIIRDITERKQAEEALQAAHDELELKVEERTAALSEANALLQALMDNMPDHIYFKDLQSHFIRTSRSQAVMLGVGDPAEVIGKSDFDFFPHAARAYAEEQEVMRSGTPLIDLEEWVVWPDGRETWVSTTKMPLRNADGQTIGIFGISRDITERKRIEQEIKQLNADLEKQAEKLQTANKELEAFSYSVSHDLRAPLRAIDGYTRILVEDYESVLDAEGRRICGIISREARRMGQLIDDLLAFSRLGRKEMYTSRIDMRGMAVSVLNELLKEEERARLDFHIGKLPAVQADSSLIRQVWFNLLTNAIKFTSRKERAVIEIGSKTTKEQLIYYVRDSGAGFDMEYANKLFGVFQRLHSESEFEGTGVGLAIVQRIIHRHEGRIWAEGEVEKGATFYFALPRKEDHHE